MSSVFLAAVLAVATVIQRRGKSIAERSIAARQTWEDAVEAEVAGADYDVDEVIVACALLGRPVATITAEADSRRSWRSRCQRFKEIMNEARVEEQKAEVQAAQREIDAVNERLQAIHAELAAARQRHNAATAALRRLSEERNAAVCEYADVRATLGGDVI